MTQEELNEQVNVLLENNSRLLNIKDKVLDIALSKEIYVSNDVDNIESVLEKFDTTLNKTDGEVVLSSNKSVFDVTNYKNAKVEVLGPENYYNHLISLNINFKITGKLLPLSYSASRTENIDVYTKSALSYSSIDQLYSDIGNNAKINLSNEGFPVLINSSNGTYWTVYLSSIQGNELSGRIILADGTDGTSNYKLEIESISVSDNYSTSPIIVYY